jgi:predicted PurR-regulated permease PerM
MTYTLEVKARLVGGLILLLLGAWILHSFIPLLAWAVVLAITTWPIYQRLLMSRELQGKVTWGSIGLTLIIATIILAPLGYGLNRLLNEAQALGQFLSDAQNIGIPAPSWLESLPILGSWVKDFWIETLGSADAAKESLHWLSTGGAMNYTKDFAGQLIHRFFSFLTILLVLFFIYQHGDGLSRQVLASSRKVFGDTGVRYMLHATAAVRATVNGMVLIGLGKGLLMGMAYAFTGLSHPAMLGALTGIFAMVPFAAKLIFSGCSLILMAQGHTAMAAGLFIYGMTLTMIADNYVRPALIAGVVKLPFIWTLLGIFAGMETMGLLGLFLGPTLMAILMSIWRDWLADMDKTASTTSLTTPATQITEELLPETLAMEFDDGQ